MPSRAECDPFSGWPLDGDETIALKRRDVRQLIQQMYEQKREILRYAERQRKSVRRAPPGFTP